jgi:hypothetical protein
MDRDGLVLWHLVISVVRLLFLVNASRMGVETEKIWQMRIRTGPCAI